MRFSKKILLVAPIPTILLSYRTRMDPGRVHEGMPLYAYLNGKILFLIVYEKTKKTIRFRISDRQIILKIKFFKIAF